MTSFYDMFNSSMHAISQSLLTPVMVVLAIFFIYALINLGILLSEYYRRRKLNYDVKKIIPQLLDAKNRKNSDEISRIINEGQLPLSHKEVLKTLAESSNQSPEFRESLALKMVEDEGIYAAKRLERTDIIAKTLHDALPIWTLIPLGPGLTALGEGDIQSLANHLLTAFDAAVLGMAAAAIAFTISKIRRRWYEEEISNLETLADTILEILK